MRCPHFMEYLIKTKTMQLMEKKIDKTSNHTLSPLYV